MKIKVEFLERENSRLVSRLENAEKLAWQVTDLEKKIKDSNGLQVMNMISI
jgi:hypothetical protein